MSDEPAFFFDVVQANGSGPTIVLRGEVDMASAERLRELVEPFLGSCRTITLDLSDLRFMDSSCLRVLEMAHRALIADDGTLFLRNPSDMARTILAVAGLDICLADDTAPLT